MSLRTASDTPAEHPDIALGLNNLAGLLRDQNKLAEAEPLYCEALEIRRAALSAGHPDIAESLNNLASLYWRLGRLNESIPVFEEAVKMTEAALGRQHVATLRTIANLGVNYKDASRIPEAIPLLEEAYQASKKEPSLAWVGQALLDAYTKAVDNTNPESTNKVTTLLRELLADARAKLPKDSPELAGQLALFSQTLFVLKAWDEADTLVRECLAIREKALPDDWRTYNTRSMQGFVLLGQKKFSAAEPLLLEGYKGMKEREVAIPPQGKKNIPDALNRLIELYTTWHAAEPNQGYDLKVAQWQSSLGEATVPAAAPPSTTNETETKK